MAVVERGLHVRTSPYWPYPPSAPQFVFLSLPHTEAFYGGAAGGGKSIALLMAALQYVDVPGYSALILRRTMRMLNQPNALMDVAHQWLGPTDAVWNGNDHRWTFPSRATLTFGYLDTERDKDNYQGAAYQFIGWDELTQFPEHFYTYVSFSRNRRAKDVAVPIRVRSTSNPGNQGHEWVKRRFILEGSEKGRPFVPAKVADNPGLDVAQYVADMQNLDHVTRQRLLEGDWDARPPGELFRREWFDGRIVAAVKDPDDCRFVRYWDLAATEPSPDNPDPDWTVGLKFALHPNGSMFVCDVKRFRATAGRVTEQIRATAESDGAKVAIVIEQDPGQAGKDQIHRFITDKLLAYNVRGNPVSGTKYVRAQPVAAKCEHGLVSLVEGAWIGAFLDELEAFTEDPKMYAHDDQVDAFSGAFSQLVKGRQVTSQHYTQQAGSEPVIRRGDLVLRGRKYVDKD